MQSMDEEKWGFLLLKGDQHVRAGVGDDDRGRVRAQIQATLDLLRTLDAGREVALFVEQRRPKVRVSARLGEFRWWALTVGMLNTIFIAPDILDLTPVQAALLYAHEFGHLLFGKDRPLECTIDSIAQEYAAESLTARIWRDVSQLEGVQVDSQSARRGRLQENSPVGAVLRRLPGEAASLLYVWQYWPAVAYILKTALGVRKARSV